ncbi:hypothetical protein KY320_02625 [Candidatus Woesearchaeota archaeon]|nr:hypothetical protein [Candidatus Woesearchaeota archaeon]
MAKDYAQKRKRWYVVPGYPNYLTIVYQDVFHLKSLYILMYEWMLEEGWKSCQGPWEEKQYGKKGDDNCEKLLYDNRSPGNRKLYSWWRWQKDAGSSYYHYFMNISFMFLGWKDVEVMHKGEKMKAQIGELTVWIRPWFEYDYGNKWANHPILKHFCSLFENRIFKQDILTKEDKLLQDGYRLQQTIKKFLEQKSFIPDKEILYEPRRKFG